MKKVLRLHPDAARELDSAIAWYDDEDASLGDEFEAAIANMLERVEAEIMPVRRIEGPVVGLCRVRMPRFPYTIIFVERRHERFVVAVAHERRKPMYWAKRVIPSQD